MVEPPEKGERATLNPNLSTKLNLRLSFNAKTLKLCSKIKLATQANQRMFDVSSSLNSGHRMSVRKYTPQLNRRGGTAGFVVLGRRNTG
jgi:hypothetical protein